MWPSANLTKEWRRLPAPCATACTPERGPGRGIDLVCSGWELESVIDIRFPGPRIDMVCYHKGATRDSCSHARIIELDNGGGPEPHELIVQEKRRVPLIPATLPRSTV